MLPNGKEKKDHLFDCGKSSATLLHNIAAYGIELTNLSLKTIILSHGHYDHTGGLKGFLENASQRIPIIGHPDVFTQ